MKTFFIYIIRVYQKIFSPDQGIIRESGLVNGLSCAFYPSCSEYMVQAMTKYGVSKGIFIGIRRILRCHPWQKERMDPLK
ncbi:MAG: membrane protein insertion efficiency factor YidD [Candidatus Paceibacterota bacterium]|jgi:hypothetical protein